MLRPSRRRCEGVASPFWQIDHQEEHGDKGILKKISRERNFLARTRFRHVLRRHPGRFIGRLPNVQTLALVIGCRMQSDTESKRSAPTNCARGSCLTIRSHTLPLQMKLRRRSSSFSKVRYIATRLRLANERLVRLRTQDACVIVETLDQPLAVSRIRFADTASA
jgi:hypothetical protein